MALPTTLTGAKLIIEFGNEGGPFISSGGNVYVVVIESAVAGGMMVMKATDPTSSFSEQDSANAPDIGADSYYYWAHQEGDVIHLVTYGLTNPQVRYHTFSMATDTWGTVNETVEGVDDPPGYAYRSVSITV